MIGRLDVATALRNAGAFLTGSALATIVAGDGPTTLLLASAVTLWGISWAIRIPPVAGP